MRKIINGWKKIMAVFMAAVIFMPLAACGSSEEIKKDDAKPYSKGYIWKVENGDKPLYLIGTIHISTNKYDFFNPEIKKIIDEVDVLGEEIDPTAEELAQYSMSLVYSDGTTIEDRLTKKEIETLKKICKDVDYDYNSVKRMKPSTIPSVLQYQGMYKHSDFIQQSFDDLLKYKFLEIGKEVVQLETLELQANVLDQIYDINALKDMLKSYKTIEDLGIKETRQSYQDFVEGNTESMEKEIKTMKKDSKKEYELLCKNRNIGMVKKIEKYLKDDKQYAVAVGCLHYFGEDGIVKLLEDKGYKVEKIEVK